VCLRTQISVYTSSETKINCRAKGVKIINSTGLLLAIPCYTWSDNKVHEFATVCLPWQHWTKALVWFDDADISAFHSCVVVDLWQSLSDWHLLLFACVLVCQRENVRA
jgi:hypothetical protein